MSAPAMRARQMPVAEQLRRTAELDAIRVQRRLTTEEQAEADNLTMRAYYRAHREKVADLHRRRRAAMARPAVSQ